MTTDMPIVSVVIATFNASRYVEAAVASALGQTLREIEVIVVDDCSTDDTVAIVERLANVDNRVRLVRLERNGGPAIARNHGIELARGRWLAILDSDDLFAPDRLQILVDVAERERADLVADNLVVFSEGNVGSASFFLDPAMPAGALSLRAYLAGTILYNEGADYGYLKPLFRLDALRRSGLRYNPELRIAEDDDFIVRLLLAGMMYWLEPVPKYFYRRHKASTSYRLSAPNALAMVEAAGAISRNVRSALPVEVASAFARREAAMVRAARFAELIDALKSRRIGWAAAIALRAPDVLLLLYMPIGAALRRICPAWLQPAKPRGDPAAIAALLQLSPLLVAKNEL
jgi:succinoglycan biosynthesis protein ExoO